MSYRRAYVILGGLALAGCPEPTATTDTAGTTATTDLPESTGTTAPEATTAGPTTGEPTTGEPTTGEPTTGEPTTGEPTTGGGTEIGPARVLYTVPGEILGQSTSLRVVEIADGVAAAPVTLIAAPEGGFVGSPTLHEGGRWVAFTGEDGERDRLWIVDRTTLAVQDVELPPEVLAIGEPSFSRDGSWLAISGGVDPEHQDLYICTIEGGCALQLFSPPQPPMASVGGLAGHVFSPSNERIVYSVHAADGGAELWIGAVAQPGEATLLAAYSEKWQDFAVRMFAGDEKTLYYSLDLDVNSQYQYFAVDLQSDPPGEPVPLSPPIVADARGRIAPDASALLWWTGDGLRGDLQYFPLSGTVAQEPALINADAPGRVYYGRFEWSKDAKRVVYLSDQELADVDGLYVVEIGDGPGAPSRISAPLAAGGGVYQHHFTPDPQKMLYFAYPGDKLGLELFLARVDAPDGAIKVNAPLPAGGALFGTYAVSPDVTRVVYAGEQEALGARELFHVELAGDEPAPPIKLNDPLPPEGKIGFDIEFSADGQRVIYDADFAPDARALYTVAIGPEGPGAPVRLSEPDERVAWSLVLPPAP